MEAVSDKELTEHVSSFNSFLRGLDLDATRVRAARDSVARLLVQAQEFAAAIDQYAKAQKGDQILTPLGQEVFAKAALEDVSIRLLCSLNFFSLFQPSVIFVDIAFGQGVYIPMSPEGASSWVRRHISRLERDSALATSKLLAIESHGKVVQASLVELLATTAASK
jgi:prefoldin subunit 5